MAGGVADMLPAGRYDRVVILDGQNESLRELDRVVAQGDVAERLTAELRTAGLSTIEAVKVAEVARHFVSPNLVYASTGHGVDEAPEAHPHAPGPVQAHHLGAGHHQQLARHAAARAPELEAQGDRLADRSPAQVPVNDGRREVLEPALLPGYSRGPANPETAVSAFSARSRPQHIAFVEKAAGYQA